jgi:TPR repeat protein
MVIAARHSYIPAMLEVAEMYMKGDGVLKSCQIAASFYKPVAEKNPRVVEMFKKATDTFHRAEAEDNLNLFQSAEEQFGKLAEMGLEPAQNNLAYIYESRGKNGNNTNETLLWYHRSSYQGNVLAKIKVGKKRRM